jgi:hypothetical protein
LALALASGATLPLRAQLPDPTALDVFPGPPSIPLDQPPAGDEVFVFPSAPASSPYEWTLLPDGLIYPSYLGGVKEPRLGSVWNHVQGRGWVWDIALGGKVGLIRWGDQTGPRPEGWQLDVDGVAFPRLDLENNADLNCTDYRAGIALTRGSGKFATKFGGYHLSSHVGDEYLILNPTFQRINYSRNALLLGESYWMTDAVRFYGEAGWAFDNDGGSEPWEFQFGMDYSPVTPGGAPFFTVNGHLREEVGFGGNLAVESGWQWRRLGSTHLFRVGGQYYNGKSRELEFFNEHEHQLGMGIWYDY